MIYEYLNILISAAIFVGGICYIDNKYPRS
jgi:hypothetical protein